MNEHIEELLNKFSVLLDDSTDNPLEYVDEIRRDYFNLSEKEKNTFLNLLYESLNEIKPVLLQFLSIINGGENNSYAMKMMGQTVLESNLSTEELFKFFIQYRYLSFVSSSSLRVELIDIYKELVHKCQKLISYSYNYIEYDKRNKGKIMLITDQLLDYRHAPTLILLNQWYYLTKSGYDVDILVVSESRISPPEFWMGPYILMNSLPLSQGHFSREYFNKTIEGTLLFLDLSDLENSITTALDYIKDSNPAFVISIGEMNLISDLATILTTVIAKTTSKNIPFTISKYVMYRDIMEYDGSEKNMRNDMVVLQDYFMNVLVPDDLGDHTITESLRKDNRYKVLIVGNRLDAEITNEFMNFMNNLADEYPNLTFVAVGKCEKFKCRVQESGYLNHYIFTGFVNNLSAVTKECDVYLNPPREGGGFSAEIALKNGIPVITLGNCDVAEWAGPEYICINIASMIDDIKKCLNDSVYMRERSQKAIERWKSRTLSEQEGIDNTKVFYEKLVEYIKNDELS